MAGVNGRDSPPPQGATNTRPSDVEAPPAQLEPQAPTDSFALPPSASSGSSVEDAKDAKAIVASLQVDGQQGPGAPAPNGGAKGDEDSGEAPVLEVVTYWDITKQFSLLGWSAFGGPAAHIGLFEKRLVTKLRWMSHAVYMELFALGSCLPGPTSTQVSFAIGTVRQGVSGGLLSGALFQYPGAVIMTGVGIGAAKVLGDPAPWLLGLTAGVSAVGVALVASAAKGLLFKLCNTKLLAIIGTLAAGAAIYWNPPWLFPLVILVGGLITLWTNRHTDCRPKPGSLDEGVKSHGFGMIGGAVLVAAWLAVLITVLVLVRTLDYDHRTEDTPLDWFEVFYRTGSIIYGGGQVVLPMLLNDLVKYDSNGQFDPERSWMTPEQFFAGLGIIQAMPGPLFNFAAYLGAIIAYNAGYFFLIGTVVAWFGLFSPGVMLMFAVLPYWKWFREFQVYRRALPGMNAAAVGLILASVFKMTVDVYKISPFPYASLCIGLFAFTAVDQLQIFEPFVVAAGLVLGVIGWAGDMN